MNSINSTNGEGLQVLQGDIHVNGKLLLRRISSLEGLISHTPAKYAHVCFDALIYL